MRTTNRPNTAQKRELCERHGHQPEAHPRGQLWVCRRCGDLLGVK